MNDLGGKPQIIDFKMEMISIYKAIRSSFIMLIILNSLSILTLFHQEVTVSPVIRCGPLLLGGKTKHLV